MNATPNRRLVAPTTGDGSTNGPWTTSDPETFPIAILSDYRFGPADPEIVATVGVGDVMGIESADECAANARLIAAAPELYEFVRAIARRFANGAVGVQARELLGRHQLPPT